MTRQFDGDDGLRITISEDAGNAAAACVGASLAAEITAAFGSREEAPFSIVAHDADVVVGGLNAASHWSWCYIRHLWVREDRRRGGFGLRLVEEAVTEARGRGCVGIYVDTFDAGAAEFYERAGFTRFGRIDGFPPGHARFFLSRRLS